MTENTSLMAAVYEADQSLLKMMEALDRLEQSLRKQDELSELISQCMLQVNLGSMQNPQAVTMKLMELGLPVWPDPSRCTDELEAERDREYAKAEKAYREAEELAVLCEEMLKKAEASLYA
ncbi:MAG: hypothetical protein IKL01_04410 [Mailhella sp.]|nr:hypothetical protein [Mailhella sp.]